MEPDSTGFRTTDEVLELLHRRGLEVNRNMLRQDVKAHYLPRLVMNPRGAGGIGRCWTPLAVERAVYLYRLRRRGVQGDLLRVLLFLHDGWGWEEVRPICMTCLQKLTRVQGRKVTERLRAPTPTNLDFLADEFAESGFKNPEVARFVWGMGFFGQILPGGSLQPLFGAFRQVYGLPDAPNIDQTAERLIAGSGLSWEGTLAAVEAADAARADDARQLVLELLQQVRKQQQSYLRSHGLQGHSSNPLTLFGCPREELQHLLRSLPGRITTAQLLASSMVIGLELARVRDDIQRLIDGQQN